MDEQNTGVAAASEPRTREIRAEIEQTREDMSETVNAIQERLRPGNIAANAADSVRHAARSNRRVAAWPTVDLTSRSTGSSRSWWLVPVPRPRSPR